ncbi:hypothetical protein [Anaerosacchariphilus polymeriproducens]|uniref:Alpha/beta hydrolase n=1 Tax=Anaerosacchariphilus polymeriproducens TaxID=1812858 RepID=A0A371AQF9_9FIRM|nr:hypothetical protein [Anaerosacchariphilus polymeriproducens]RDU21806.1 hypothetical protein DWV06_17630 [Anaerosacchariphilus polymeriproducens]
MEIREYGINNQKNILLVHGGYVSYKTLKIQIEELQKGYHIFVPLLDGHNINDKSELNSIEEEASKILKFFKLKNINKIHCMCGASLGADIIIEILFQKGNFAENAFIESGSLGINKILAIPLIWISKTAMYKGVRGNRYWEKFIEKFLIDIKMPKELCCDTKELLRHMSISTIKNVQKLVCNYKIKENVNLITTKCLVVYSSKEKLYMENPYKKLQETIDMKIVCLEGYNHGQLSIGEPQKQLKMLKEFLV